MKTTLLANALVLMWAGLAGAQQPPAVNDPYSQQPYAPQPYAPQPNPPAYDPDGQYGQPQYQQPAYDQSQYNPYGQQQYDQNGQPLYNPYPQQQPTYAPSPQAPLADGEEDIDYDVTYDTTADTYDDGYDSQAYTQFESTLSPYGQWIDMPSYGRVWSPSVGVVGAGFSPYGSGGHFVLSDYGWTWVSDWNWGWAPFHYGRWMNQGGYGWCWLPGRNWGPAWVSWRFGGGYAGWAPLPPAGIRVPPPPAWGASPWRFTVAAQLGSARPVFLPPRVVPTVFARTAVVTNVRTVSVAGGSVRINAGPSAPAVAAAVGHPVTAVSLGSVAPHALPHPTIAPRAGIPIAARPWVQGRSQAALGGTRPAAIPPTMTSPRPTAAQPFAGRPPTVATPPGIRPAQPTAAPHVATLPGVSTVPHATPMPQYNPQAHFNAPMPNNPAAPRSTPPAPHYGTGIPYHNAPMTPPAANSYRYNAPTPYSPPRYAPPAPRYGVPSYAPHYSAPMPRYSAPTPHYSAPTPHYSAPMPRYSAPAPHYSAPAPHYSAPMQHYSAPAQHYSAPVQHYSAPAQHYSAPAQQFSAPHFSGGGGRRR